MRANPVPTYLCSLMRVGCVEILILREYPLKYIYNTYWSVCGIIPNN